MRSFEEIGTGQIQEFLNTGWISHDAAWLTLCAEAIGMEKTNAINRASARQMARNEGRRLLRLLGMKSIQNYQELEHFIRTAFQIIKGSFMKFELEFPGENRMVWKVPRCFAYEGMKRMNLIAAYECGIVERLVGWMEALQIPVRIQPHPVACLMHGRGSCQMEIVFW